MKQSYSDRDLEEELTELAKTLWEIDYPKKQIKRKPNVIGKKVPIQAIYRMVRIDRLENESSILYHFPFTKSNFKGVLGLAEGWKISVNDRKYLEKDIVLFADDQETIIVLPENKRWWETSWYHLLSIAVGFTGSIIGFVSWLKG